MFTDLAKIRVISGKGGDGSVSFRREKYVSAGGPDGGDGGRGGDILVEIDDNMNTLAEFRLKRKFAAEDGAPGTGKNSSGKAGKSLTIRVPRGTLIRDAETGLLIKDMSDGGVFTLCRGGRGGWGNQHFATPTRQAPRFAKSGLPGLDTEVVLELKLLADVGLCGFPNVGKSTLLSSVTSARPKIANYHFTTLTPNLGVVRVSDERSFVMADIPGIIEGAADGAGLGHDFLRHIERCRLLVHVIDASSFEGRDPAEDFDAVNRELQSYSPVLASRPQIIAANKCDAMFDREPLDRLYERAGRFGAPVFEISAVTGEGVEKLVYAVSEKLLTLPPVEVFEPEFEPEPPEADAASVEITRDSAGVFELRGAFLERLMANVNFSDYESRMYFDRTLRRSGIFDMLEARGIEEGDTVRIYSLEFEYAR